MTELLSHIFGNKPHTPVQARDPNLMQGERFDFMQNAITSRVLPALPLLEQTTGPGLGSIVEPLEVASQSDTKNQYNSVSALNEAEMGKLQQMENQYQDLVNQLIQLDTESSNPATYKPCNITCDDIPCGACARGCEPSCCVAGASTADACPGGSRNWCACNGRDPSDCPKTLADFCPSVANAATIHSQLAALNTKINASINKLIKQTMKTHGVNNTAKDVINTHGQNLRSQLNTLMEKKSRLDSLIAKRETLRGQLDDRRRELDSSYLHYLAWFLSAVTLGALAFNKLAKD